MHRISSNNSRGNHYFFAQKGGDYLRESDYFKYCSLEVAPFKFCFIYPTKTRKVITYGLFKSFKFGYLINFPCQYPQHHAELE